MHNIGAEMRVPVCRGDQNQMLWFGSRGMVLKQSFISEPVWHDLRTIYRSYKRNWNRDCASACTTRCPCVLSRPKCRVSRKNKGRHLEGAAWCQIGRIGSAGPQFASIRQEVRCKLPGSRPTFEPTDVCITLCLPRCEHCRPLRSQNSDNCALLICLLRLTSTFMRCHHHIRSSSAVWRFKCSVEGLTSCPVSLYGWRNNAGVMKVPYGLMADGIETHFGTNHIGMPSPFQNFTKVGVIQNRLSVWSWSSAPIMYGPVFRFDCRSIIGSIY